MTDGLKDNHRNAIIDILSANKRIERVVLFGSRTMGTYTMTSDVDLVLYGDHLTLTDQAHLTDALDKLTVPQRVDLILHNVIDNDELCKHIERHGIEWYRRQQDMGLNEAIDITDDQRKVVYALIERHLPNTTTWVYGSRAKWTARPQSDLDMVVFTTPEQNSQVFGLREAFEESNLPFRVDLFVWDDMPERFRKRIEAEHVVLVERGERGAGDGWRTTTLGEVVTLQRGFDLPRTERKLGSYPVIASTGPVGTHDRAVVQGPGVVIGRSGSLGGGQFIKHDFWPLNTTLWVKDFNNNDPRFCYFFLKSLDLAQFNAGSGVPTLNRNHIHPLPVRVPPLPEQRAIAHILGILDDKIELNRCMNETLEEMARALFKSWFVDFDPVRAKMEGRDTGLPPDVAALFPDRLVESELGEIPEGWEVVPLPEMIEVNPPRSLRKGEVAPYLDMANMPTRGHVPDTVIDRPFGSGMRFTNGDTLVARITPCLENGKTAYVDFLHHDRIGWGSTEYIVMRPKPPLPNEFAYCLARSTGFREFAIQNMTGTSGRQRVPAQALSQFLLPSPPEPLAARFGKVVQPLFARASEAVRESRTFAALRDTLLPKLVSGELRVAHKFHNPTYI